MIFLFILNVWLILDLLDRRKGKVVKWEEGEREKEEKKERRREHEREEQKQEKKMRRWKKNWYISAKKIM